MGKSSRSSLSRVCRVSPFVEEGGQGWMKGVGVSCGVVSGANRADDSSLEQRRYEGMMRLLRRIYEGVGNDKKKVQGDEKQDGSVEVRPRLSDGTKAHYPRKALVG